VTRNSIKTKKDKRGGIARRMDPRATLGKNMFSVVDIVDIVEENKIKQSTILKNGFLDYIFSLLYFFGMS